MKILLTACAISTCLLTGSAFAQGSGTAPSSTPQATTQPPAQQSQAAAQQIQQDLKSAGFTDVKVVAESFVVQAKTKDGNPVLMTFGPHGMSMFEAMQTTGANGTTSGSSQTTTGSSTSGQSSSK